MKIPELSFSLKRAVGISALKGKIAFSDTAITAGITSGGDWLNLLGLAL